MDERAHYTFERAIEWNYTIVEGEASLVPPDSPLYETIREAFIRKNHGKWASSCNRMLRCTTSNVDNWCAQVQEERCASFAMLSSGSESANTFRPVRGREGLLRYVLRAYCGTKTTVYSPDASIFPSDSRVP